MTTPDARREEPTSSRRATGAPHPHTCDWEDNRLRICERPAPFTVTFSYPIEPREQEDVCLMHALILVAQHRDFEWRELTLDPGWTDT